MSPEVPAKQYKLLSTKSPLKIMGVPLSLLSMSVYLPLTHPLHFLNPQLALVPQLLITRSVTLPPSAHDHVLQMQPGVSAYMGYSWLLFYRFQKKKIFDLLLSSLHIQGAPMAPTQHLPSHVLSLFLPPRFTQELLEAKQTKTILCSPGLP